MSAFRSRLAAVDRRIRTLFATTTLLFIGAVALQVHGSSIALWKNVLNDSSAPSGILFSTAKAVRTDEWLAWTPAVLAQARHNPPFPVENPNIGAGKTPLLVNLPARHYAMFFRPQLYGFFLFGLETGYAWYWNVKLFGLFVSFFVLLRLLLSGNFWLPVFGSGWLCFSAYTQWWFSCPPMLPEMLGSWAIAIFCFIQLFRRQRLIARILFCLLLLIATVNFTLCFYPPFQIPLVYAGGALLAGWFWQNHGRALELRAGIVSIAATAIAIAFVLIPYVIECKTTLEIVAATKYPGARRSHGGDLNPADTFNGVLGFFNWSEEHFLATRGNSSEASNFYPLWILVAMSAGLALWRERRQRRIELTLLTMLTIFSFYTFSSFPNWLSRLTFLNYVTGTRALLAIGVAGILFSLLVLARGGKPEKVRDRIVLACLAFGGVLVALFGCGPAADPFLSAWRCGLLLALNALFIALYLFAPLRIFCGTFLLCLVLNNGLVNPIATGLGSLLDSDTVAMIREIRQRDPRATWMVYSRSSLAQFLKAQGIDVVNGLQYVPDLGFWRELDPVGRYSDIYNRYAFSTFELAGGTRRFSLLKNVAYVVDVAATDPILAQCGVRYAVFPDQVDDPAGKGLRFVAAAPGGRLWIYRIHRGD